VNMKIAFIGTRGFFSRYGGVEISTHDIAGRLAERGHEVIVYCWKDQVCLERTLPKNIRLVYIPTINTKHLGAFIHTLLSTLHVLFLKTGIAHYQALGPSFFSFLPRLAGKKTVVTIHSQDWKRRKWNACARSFLKFCELTAVFFPNKTVTVSRALKGYYQTRFNKTISYIPNAVNIPEIPADSDIKNRNIILFTGRLVPEKRIECLIQAFNGIRPDMDLIIAGEAAFDPGYVARLGEISAGNNRIRFPGRVSSSQLDELYRKAYIFVLPSELEGAPLSLLEAMSYGVCPVCADIPECQEIAGNSAVYFRSGDQNDLRDKIKFLIDNPAIRLEKGLMARKRVIERYNWKTVIDGLEGIYFSLKSR
jgi:glycosyltransferase involved in cell wall biosynthesis